MAESGIAVLTQKGREAITSAPQDMSSLCRNILVQVDGNKSLENLQKMFRGLKGFEDSMQKLFAGGYIEVARDCKDLVKALVQQILGPKAPTIIKKIDEMHAKYGDACWEHMDELDKLARMFYGEVVADDLKMRIASLVQESRK